MVVLVGKPKELGDFLVEKTKDVTSIPTILDLAREFADVSGTADATEAVNAKIRRFRARIHAFENYNLETKIKLMLALGTSIDENFLEELRSNATVVIDHKKRIQVYEANDGSLSLCRPAKKLRNNTAKRKSLVITQELVGNPRSPNADLVDTIDEMNDDGAGDSWMFYDQSQPTPTKIRKADVKIEPQEEEDFSSYQYGSTYTPCSSSFSGDTISAIEFLKLLQNLVETLDLPILQELHQMIKNKLEDVMRNDLKVPVHSIKIALQSLVQLSMRHATEFVSEDESVNLGEFMIILRTTTFHLNSPKIIEFKKLFSHMIKAASIRQENLRIPLKKLQCGVAYALEFVLP